ncbi:kinase-like domain-containing protein [Cerioporus squamosus]|nr:kinase-like domain-containing protein [Cerioporus squamosus]
MWSFRTWVVRHAIVVEPDVPVTLSLVLPEVLLPPWCPVLNPLMIAVAPPVELQAQSLLIALRRHPMKKFRSATEELPSGAPLHLTDKTYVATANDVIMDRYLVLSSLGRGSFGTVVRTVDKVTGTGVAIKVLHKDEDLNVDPREKLFAAVLDYGSIWASSASPLSCAKALCATFPVTPGRQLVEIAYQMGLLPSVRVIPDLHSLGSSTVISSPTTSPCSAETVTVRWLDAITGFHDKDDKPLTLLGRVGNRGYRAPEISFGTVWSFGVDTFALGCVIAELYLGRDLFPADMMREHLAMVDKLVGPFSEEYAHSIEDKLPGTFSFVGRVAIRFPRAGVALSAEEHGEPMRRLENLKPLSATIHDTLLYDLVRKLMMPDPVERLEMDAAAKHAYFDVLAKLQWQ